jgi:Nif-specific regulatory protein
VFLFAENRQVGRQAVSDRSAEPTAGLPIGHIISARAQPDGVDAGSRLERDLRALLNISTIINSAQREDQVHTELLNLLADAVGYHAAVILRIGDDGAPVVVQTAPPQSSIEVNRGVVSEALAAGRGIVRDDGPLQHVLCVPMALRNTVLGAIYLTNSRPGAFAEADLQLVTAIGALTAVALENAQHVAWLQSETERLQSDLHGVHSLVGTSEPMRRVYEIVGKVARSDSTTVLITGETGTGKELVARAVHLNSPRAKRPFIAINCAALTESLLETELFGHERGAFTGAVAQKKGKLELAEGGTVFLDEVGELAPTIQSKLLRALQERHVDRVGGTKPIKVDVRVISASNRDLREEVAARRFREDLYHRLKVVDILMPPLRARGEDIALLANHFVARFARKAPRPVRGISPAAMRYLKAYDWPGNVRELENTIECAMVLGSSAQILPDDLPEALLHNALARGPELARFHDAVRQTKRQTIVDAVRQARGSYVEAARLLGLHPNYLHRLIRNLDLKPRLEEER